MALFETKKKEPTAEGEKSPKDIIQEMKSKNYSNNQIVEYLQKQGMKSQEIFDMMNKVDAGPSAGPIGGPTPIPKPINPMASGPQPGPMSSGGMSKEQIEEISESIVDEKMEDFQKESKKITDWKDTTETRLTAMETRLEELAKNFEALHTGVLGKIEEYDKGLTDVGTEIKALEKVFSKILPTLTENVSELGRITKNLKAAPKAKK